MLSIAFFTLMERKVIGYSQSRKGPNKILITGIVQPIADAIKLLSKEVNLNFNSNVYIYIVAPLINIICSMIIWIIFPFIFTFRFMKISILFILCCITFNTTSIMIIR